MSARFWRSLSFYPNVNQSYPYPNLSLIYIKIIHTTSISRSVKRPTLSVDIPYGWSLQRRLMVSAILTVGPLPASLHNGLDVSLVTAILYSSPLSSLSSHSVPPNQV